MTAEVVSLSLALTKTMLIYVESGSGSCVAVWRDRCRCVASPITLGMKHVVAEDEVRLPDAIILRRGADDSHCGQRLRHFRSPPLSKPRTGSSVAAM